MKQSLAKIGKRQSIEVIENRRQKILGRKQPREEIERRRQSLIGHRHTDEARMKMSKSKKVVCLGTRGNEVYIQKGLLDAMLRSTRGNQHGTRARLLVTLDFTGTTTVV